MVFTSIIIVIMLLSPQYIPPDPNSLQNPAINITYDKQTSPETLTPAKVAKGGRGGGGAEGGLVHGSSGRKEMDESREGHGSLAHNKSRKRRKPKQAHTTKRNVPTQNLPSLVIKYPPCSFRTMAVASASEMGVHHPQLTQHPPLFPKGGTVCTVDQDTVTLATLNFSVPVCVCV